MDKFLYSSTMQDLLKAYEDFNLYEKQHQYNCPEKHGLIPFVNTYSCYKCDFCYEKQGKDAIFMDCRQCN